MNPRSARSLRLLPGLLALIVLMPAVAGVAVAADGETATPAVATAPTPQLTADGAETFPLAIGGMVVSIDAETGRLRQPTKEEAQQLAAELEGLYAPQNRLFSASRTPIQFADGTVGMQLDASFDNYSVVHLTAEGEAVTDCVHGLETAEQAVNETATAGREER